MVIARVQMPDGRIGRFEVEEGTTPQEIEAYVSQQFLPEQEQPRGDFTEPMSVAALKPGEPVATGEPRPGAETLSALARPTLGGVGAVIGAVAGTTGAPGPGTLAGSGLGFAAGEELADKLDEWLGVRDRQPLSVELVQSGKDIATGAAFEAGGQLLAAGLGAGAKFVAKRLPKISLTKSGAQKQAGKIIAANTTGGPVIAKNIEEAQALEEAIPGLKFGRGQTTNDPAIIKFERSRQRMPGDAAEQTAEQTAANSKALRAFIDKQKGGAGIGDVVDPLIKQREAVEAGVDTAAGALEREAATLGTGADAAEAGATIRGAAGTGKAAAKKEAGKLFEDVPQFDIDSSSLGTKIDELSKPFSRVENIEANIPSVFGRTKALLEETGGVLTPDDLQGIRSELTTDLRRVQGGQEPNARKASRISGLIGEIDDILKKASASGERLTKEFIINPTPGADDILEYESLSARANEQATANIKARRESENIQGYKDSLRQAKEIVGESSDFDDFSDIISQGGLNLETAHMMSDKETIKELINRRPTLFRKGSSLHAEHYANKKGFDTPDEMFQDWLSRDKRSDKIRTVADDLFNEFQLSKEAELSEIGFEEFIEEEIKAFNKISKNKPPKTGQKRLNEF
jgi:hypothetical protein